jgi:hypothetical protein
MKHWLGLGFFLLSFIFLSGQGLPALGNWRDHLPLRKVLAVVNNGERVEVGTAFGLFGYDPATREFSRMSKSSGLAEVKIRKMSGSPLNTQQLVVYENSNIDLVDGDQIINIPDILISRTSSPKGINHVLWDGKTAYLSADLGIVVLDTERRLIKATYRPSADGRDVQVYQVAIYENEMYAATSQGLVKCPLNDNQMADFRNWVPVTIMGAVHPPHAVVSWDKNLIAMRGDTLFAMKNNSWSLGYIPTKPVTFIQASGKDLFVGTSQLNRGSLLHFSALQLPPQKIESDLFVFPTACTLTGNIYWVGDSSNGLIQVTGSVGQQIIPDAPAGIPKGRVSFSAAKIIAPSGFVSAAGVPEKNYSGIDVFENDSWKNLNSKTIRGMDSLPDIMHALSDKVNSNILAGSFGGGLAQISADGKISLLKYGSPIAPSLNSPADFRVAGMAFDLDNQLWVSNPGTSQPLLLRKQDGSWKKFSIPLAQKPDPGAITIDIDNKKWIVVQGGGGLISFDDGGTPDQSADDRWRLFRQGRGNGNLPSSNVLSVAADKNGFIWVGTDRGVAIIQCGEDIFSAGLCEATLPIVKQDNFAGLLLAEEYVSDIQVDQADRKWIATKNGVWLLSADGQKTIHRFTSSNSKLLDNEVFSIAIHDQTGEVFFLTRGGISSFRSTATAPALEKRKPFIFPNPVAPGYTGTIAFRDLPDKAWVKITELTGKLVHETRSLGGQAVWNGKNLQGQRANSGVYLVYVADELNQMQLAGKIVFIK